MNDKDLHEFCLRWIEWRKSRRLYVKTRSGNVLARFQPSKVGVERDAPLDAEMQFFDQAVTAMRNMDEHREVITCFWLFYVEQIQRIKVVAGRMQIGRRTFYDRVHRAARIAHELGVVIALAQAAMCNHELADVD